MKASDYRVGNIIDPYKPRRITGNDIRMMDASIRNCPPIEISKEWLDKSEMKMKKYLDTTFYTIDMINNCGIWFNDVKGIRGGVVLDFEGENGEMYEDIDVISEIKYVHELQNIYFVFTGKELEFNK